MSYPVFQVPAGDVLPIMFTSYAGATGASVTLTGLAVTDIEIYKDGSVTQRASDAGYTLLDTDGIDFDLTTGLHGFSIDTGDNTDASFYTVGAWFTVVVSAVTIDAQTVTFIACQFRLMAAEGVAGVPDVNATHITDQAVTCAAPVTVLASVGTAATSTAQTGDAFARLGAPAGASVSADVAAVKVDTAAVKTKTDFLPSATAGAAGGVFIAGANAATSITTALTANITGNVSGSVGSVTGAVGSVTGLTAATVHADLDDIQTRLPASLVGGRINANTSAIGGVVTAASRLALSTQGIVTGTVGAASNTTSIVTSALDPSAAVTDQFKGRIVTFKQDTTTANLAGQSTDITASTALGVLTVTALTTAPVSGDTFTIT